MTFNPYENRVQYDLLTTEERDELMREGPLLVWIPEFNDWMSVDRGRNFRGDAVYCRAPKPDAVMPTVDWSCFGPAIKAVAWGSDGESWAFTGNPVVNPRGWSNFGICGAYRLFTFYPARAVTRGTCNWKDSLVLRPEGV
jgi:hypothetical protein